MPLLSRYLSKKRLKTAISYISGNTPDLNQQFRVMSIDEDRKES